MWEFSQRETIIALKLKVSTEAALKSKMSRLHCTIKDFRGKNVEKVHLNPPFSFILGVLNKYICLKSSGEGALVSSRF